MTPLTFEAIHGPMWTELGELLDEIEQVPKPGVKWPKGKFIQGALLSELYRRSCEHLVAAKARAYPIPMIERLESLTHRAHRIIYRRRDYGVLAFRQLVLVDIPEAVRAHRWYVLIAALAFYMPLLMAGIAAYIDRDFILNLMDAKEVASFDAMYSSEARKLGQPRGAEDDWTMFGYYVQHNITIGFQCFASGMLAGVGSMLVTISNGLSIGAVAGYLTAQGHSENFYSFVVTHSAFELTAIVLSAAAGLRLGHAFLAPGRRTRLEALQHNARGAVVVVYGVFGMLVMAAFLEAFWSSSRWVSPPVKYAAGAICWVLVVCYLVWQGRPQSTRPQVPHAR